MMKSTVFIVFVLAFGSLGVALKCPTCFSRESGKQCDAVATLRTCTEPDAVCALYHSESSFKGGVYMRYCSTLDRVLPLQAMCNKPPSEVEGLGLVTCRAECEGCSSTLVV